MLRPYKAYQKCYTSSVMELEPVIGLEVHAQLLTESKIFCGCSTRFGAPPNSNVCPVCLGLPGALPVLNQKAVELALMASLALECTIPAASIFARKNYFYPDLPKGYQISQFDHPLAIDGRLNVNSRDIRIKRLHMEEDAGKLLHEGVEANSDASYVDLNRAGVPLIEIVSEPDLRTPKEAYDYLTELKAILRYCEVSSANMEEGNLRCDANVSLRPAGSSKLGTKVEIKNLNSFKNVQKALEYEISRQEKALRASLQIQQETRLFDADRGVTESMRSKEEAHDYRYFPDPDLLPLQTRPEQITHFRAMLPELPQAKQRRFEQQYALSTKDAETLTNERALADFYEQTARLSKEPKQSANWILRDVLQYLKNTNLSIEQARIRPEHISELIDLVKKGAITGNQAKEVFETVSQTGKTLSAIVAEKGLSQISNESEIENIVQDVLNKNADVVERYKNGETKLLGALVGMVMKATAGKANPAIVNRLMKEKLA